MGAKSPVLAAVISVFLPGVGHFYCGAWTRGLIIMLGSYAVCALASLLGPAISVLTVIAVDAAVAYDAWKTAKIEGAAAAAEAAAPAEVTWIHWPWAAVRAAWIAGFVFLFGWPSVKGIAWSLREREWGTGAFLLLWVLIVSVIGWLAARSTWRVMNRTTALTPGAARNEIGATIFFGGLAGLLFMTAYPSFKDLTRKSAEGAMKGRLGQLRSAFSEYRAAKSENPPSLDALLGAPDLAKMPYLWTSGRQPHEETRAAVILPDGKPTDSGKWAYVVGTSTPIFIDCTHTDSKGIAWNAY